MTKPWRNITTIWSDKKNCVFVFISVNLTGDSTHQRTKPRQVDLYDVFCAILYILKNGSQWRALPHDFPKWQTVYTYFRLWSQQSAPTEPSLLDQVLKKLSLPYDLNKIVRR